MCIDIFKSFQAQSRNAFLMLIFLTFFPTKKSFFLNCTTALQVVALFPLMEKKLQTTMVIIPNGKVRILGGIFSSSTRG